MKRFRLFAAASAVLFVSQAFIGAAGAAMLDEPPDFPGSSPGAPETLVLTPGSNTVTGISSTPGGGGTADLDDFIVTVQAGQFLTSIQLAWTVLTGTTVESFQSAWSFNGSPLENVTLQSTIPANIDMNPLGMFAAALPLGAGSYVMNQRSLAVSDKSQNVAGSFSYTWTFNVVPLPPAAWLLVSGLLAMFGLSRRRQAA